MNTGDHLLPRHGGYRHLKSFQVAQLVYDVTVRFCDRYVDRFSRTRDQMVQAARSGVQNIAEGSQTSATSKKSELRLTTVSRVSLESTKSTLSTLATSALAANATLTLIAVANSLLNRQIAFLAETFENEGGFSERLHRLRLGRRESAR